MELPVNQPVQVPLTASRLGAGSGGPSRTEARLKAPFAADGAEALWMQCHIEWIPVHHSDHMFLRQSSTFIFSEETLWQLTFFRQLNECRTLNSAHQNRFCVGYLSACECGWGHRR